MAYEGVIPPLGFEGERFAPTKRSLLIPTLKGNVQVYAHSGPVEGYNVFFPEPVVPTTNETYMSHVIGVKTPFEVKMAVQGYIGTLTSEGK